MLIYPENENIHLWNAREDKKCRHWVTKLTMPKSNQFIYKISEPWRRMPQNRSLRVLRPTLLTAMVRLGIRFIKIGSTNSVPIQTCYTQKVNETGENLEGKCDCNTDNEQEKGHDKISKVTAIPRRMSNDWPLSSSMIHQNHQLQTTHQIKSTSSMFL